jgi:hypothetical protein
MSSTEGSLVGSPSEVSLTRFRRALSPPFHLSLLRDVPLALAAVHDPLLSDDASFSQPTVDFHWGHLHFASARFIRTRSHSSCRSEGQNLLQKNPLSALDHNEAAAGRNELCIPFPTGCYTNYCIARRGTRHLAPREASQEAGISGSPGGGRFRFAGSFRSLQSGPSVNSSKGCGAWR